MKVDKENISFSLAKGRMIKEEDEREQKKNTIYISFSVGFIQSTKRKLQKEKKRRSRKVVSISENCENGHAPFANVIRKKCKVLTREYMFSTLNCRLFFYQRYNRFHSRALP